MPTLTQLKTACAAYLQCATTDFTSGGVDLWLMAANQAVQMAENSWDFEFTRALYSLDVGTVLGVELSDAVMVSGYANAGTIQTIMDVGQLDGTGNFVPVVWTTVGDSLERQRETNPNDRVLYPTDAQARMGPAGQPRFLFTGSNVRYWPKPDDGVNQTLTIYLEVYTNTVEFDASSLTASFEPWSTTGAQYLLWSTVNHLNYLRKEFVPRTEGNLATPLDLQNAGLEALKIWDTAKYEQYRRHNR